MTDLQKGILRVTKKGHKIVVQVVFDDTTFNLAKGGLSRDIDLVDGINIEFIRVKGQPHQVRLAGHEFVDTFPTPKTPPSASPKKYQPRHNSKIIKLNQNRFAASPLLSDQHVPPVFPHARKSGYHTPSVPVSNEELLSNGGIESNNSCIRACRLMSILLGQKPILHEKCFAIIGELKMSAGKEKRCRDLIFASSDYESDARQKAIGLVKAHEAFYQGQLDGKLRYLYPNGNPNFRSPYTTRALSTTGAHEIGSHRSQS